MSEQGGLTADGVRAVDETAAGRAMAGWVTQHSRPPEPPKPHKSYIHTYIHTYIHACWLAVPGLLRVLFRYGYLHLHT